MSSAIRISLCLMLVAAVAHADAAQGKKLNAQGMQRVGKKDWSGALALFKQAIAADPGSVLAHYNAASMESRLGEIDDAAADLAWLAASTDPAAARALAKGKTDPDLERASLDARVRTAIGVPALASMSADAIVLERSGAWSEDGSACAAPGVTLTFKKGGRLTVESHWGCDATDQETKEAGTWKAKDGGLVLTSRTIFKGGSAATFGPCDEGKPAVCLRVADTKEGNDHAFRRGADVVW
jgi:hypothetical protein